MLCGTGPYLYPQRYFFASSMLHVYSIQDRANQRQDRVMEAILEAAPGFMDVLSVGTAWGVMLVFGYGVAECRRAFRKQKRRD